MSEPVSCQQSLLSSTAPGGEDFTGKRNAAGRGQGRKKKYLYKLTSSQNDARGPLVPTQHRWKMSTPRRSWAGVSRCHQPLSTTSQLQNALVQPRSEQALWKCLIGRRGTRATPLGQSCRSAPEAMALGLLAALFLPCSALPCMPLHAASLQSPAPALTCFCSPSPSRCQPSIRTMADPTWCVGASTQTARSGANRLDMLVRRPPGWHRPTNTATRKLYSRCKCLPANNASPSRPNTTRECMRTCAVMRCRHNCKSQEQTPRVGPARKANQPAIGDGGRGTGYCRLCAKRPRA